MQPETIISADEFAKKFVQKDDLFRALIEGASSRDVLKIAGIGTKFDFETVLYTFDAEIDTKQIWNILEEINGLMKTEVERFSSVFRLLTRFKNFKSFQGIEPNEITIEFFQMMSGSQSLIDFEMNLVLETQS